MFQESIAKRNYCNPQVCLRAKHMAGKLKVREKISNKKYAHLGGIDLKYF